MDDPHSHKASSVYPDKALRKLLCKLRDGNSCFVHLISQNMNLRIPSIHQNMQNPGRKPGILLCEINTDIIRGIKMLSNL